MPVELNHTCGFGGSLGKADNSRQCVDLVAADPDCEYAKFNNDGGYADCYCCSLSETDPPGPFTSTWGYHIFGSDYGADPCTAEVVSPAVDEVLVKEVEVSSNP